MKYVEEYRDRRAAEELARAIRRETTRPWTVMEVCGGQTHAILRFGVDKLLPPEIALVHGPGCPVCVTPVETIDKAIEIASRPEVIFASFGDMLRVPGTSSDLLSAKAAGADVRIVYTPLDALEIAKKNPEREVVFFAVGFETTAPANALLAYQARARGIRNLSLLVAHVRVPPALEAILASPRNRVQGFLAAGHVCAVMGYEEYEPIAARYRVPIVVTGFEPVDILQGLLLCIRQFESGRASVENQYSRVVTREGNRAAQKLLREVFEVRARRWRGIGEIPESGLWLRGEYAEQDAELKFGKAEPRTAEETGCLSGLVLQGIIKPPECPAFATRCTPERPFGATMVSSEGACAAYYRYRRLTSAAATEA